MGRRILKESETILAMTPLILRDKGIRGTKITEQIQNYNESGTNFVTSQNFIYNPISKYDDILLTYGKNMHSQRFVYGAKDKDKGLIKIDSYQKYGNKWNDNMSATYVAPADYINVNYAEETFTQGKAPITQYVIKDIRGSIEQLTSKQGYKAITYTYTAFGEEKFPMNLNDIHGFAGYVRDRETDSYYANARQYLPQIHRFMSKDKLRVDSLNRYLYVMNNPVNLVDPSGLFVMNPRDIPANNSTLCAGTLDNALDCLQGALDVVGFAFDVADGINSIISFMRGNIIEGVINLIGVIPAVGSAIATPMKSMLKAIDMGSGITKYVKDIIKVLGGTGAALDKLRGAKKSILGIIDSIPGKIDDLIKGVNDSWFARTFLSDNTINALNSLKSSISNGISTFRNKVSGLFGSTINSVDSEVTKQITKENAEKAAKEQARKAAMAKSSKKAVQKPPKNRKFSGLENRGYKPKPGERTLNGFVQKHARDSEISLYTNSKKFNSDGNYNQFKRFGSGSHGGISPHVHQPVRNVTKNRIYSGVGSKTKNGGVTYPGKKDVKQLYDNLFNGKYMER